MQQIISAQTGRDALMSRLNRWVQDERYEEALSAVEQFLGDEPQDRECRLLRLLFEIKLHGVTLHEHEVEQIGSFADLGPREKIIVKHIFALTTEELATEGPTDRVLACQRVARRLFPESFVSRSFSPTEKLVDFTYIGKGILAVAKRPVEYISPVIREGVLKVRMLTRRGVAKILSLAGSLTAREMGWRWGGTLGVIGLISLFSFQYDPEKATSNNQAEVAAIHQVTSQNRVLGVKDLGFEVWGGNQDPNLTEQLAQWSESQISTLLPLYEKRVKSHPDLMGSMVLQLKTDTSGAVVQVTELQSRLKDPEFKDAVVKQAYQWKFAGNYSEPLHIEYPLLFVPVGMDPMTLVRWELALASRPEEEQAKQPDSDNPQNGPSVGDEEVQELSLVVPSSQPEDPTGRNEAYEDPAPTLSKEETKREEPMPASNGRSIRKGKIKQAAATRKIPLSVADPSPAEIRIKPMPGSETSDEGLGVYKARVTTTVREDRGFAAPTLETIAAGTEVNILDANGEWLRVRTNGGTGKIGYIRKEFVVPAEP
ncbi:MAG: AgmX/PglI C-terminal domain-containing protein [Candidatus Binatia bacterium]